MLTVAATPGAVYTLCQRGHPVLVEQDAGAASGFTDEDYLRAGATIAPTAEDIYDRAAWIWKVCRPGGHELSLLRPGQTVFCLLHPGPLLHPAPLPDTVRAVALDAWEHHGEFPVLAAMSAIAGRLALLHAAAALQHPHGQGMLLGGLPGIEPARVLILGSGPAGYTAALYAARDELDAEVFGQSLARIRQTLRLGLDRELVYAA